MATNTREKGAKRAETRDKRPQAHVKHVRISPRKVKIVIDLIRGKNGDEALAIAVYCALKYPSDIEAALIAAVNHDGDSDSTGAVTGNILGATNGYDSIEAKWKNDLELMDVLLEMSDDLCQGCLMSEYDLYCDPVWARKYIEAHRKG